MFNAATSPLSALTGLTVGQVCTHPELRTQVDRLIDEALPVCTAAGIELLRDPAESVQEAIDEAYWHLPSMTQDVRAHVPSMTQDVRAQRKAEIDVLNGGIAAEGRRVAVPTRATTRWSPWYADSSRPGRHRPSGNAVLAQPSVRST